MKKSIIIAILFLSIALPVSAQIHVTRFRTIGPGTVNAPYLVDSVNVKGKSYDESSVLKSVPFAKLAEASFQDFSADCNAGDTAGKCKDSCAETGTTAADADTVVAKSYFLGFSLQNADYSIVEMNVEGLARKTLYLDGKKIDDKTVKLEPGTHDFTIAALATDAEISRLDVNVSVKKGGEIALREDGKHIYSLEYNSKGINCSGVDISPSGKYAVLKSALTKEGGKIDRTNQIVRLSDNRVVKTTDKSVDWLPGKDAIYFKEEGISSSSLVCEDIETGVRTVLAQNFPEHSFDIAPTLDYAICLIYEDGPAEGEVHQIVSPEDRQPGWRKRCSLSKFDFATGTLQPLTFGFHSSWLCDITRDGKKILFMTTCDYLTQRPSTVFSIYEMDLETLSTRCLVKDDGGISSAFYSPDGKSIAIIGSAEALGGVGNALADNPQTADRIPNHYDVQMFLMNVDDQKVTPIVKNFNPSIESAKWSLYDGKIYFTAADKDCINFFRADPKDCSIERLNNLEEVVGGFALAQNSPSVVYYGQSICNSHRAYLLNTKNGRQCLLRDYSAEKLADVCLGDGLPFEFTSSRGDMINGFYVLPPDFDPTKKYPLIVHYYGGCNPSDRAFNGSYSPHLYSSQGYVFYVVNPSGASGFGQEFASRHVNTAGEGVAEDIIEATKRFCEEHPFVDSSKIGCYSASYGGFMTQLLMTKTDIYACGISHAGISDHTSYWGEGYWGYTYSQICMADSYPWTRKDLYVDRSPLYNADKIHTPLLFLHGSADTNVPIGESIQMYTALKVLGAEAEFVVVDGENHGIRDYEKRRAWLRTKFAWFAKYLKGDDTWWNELYPLKNL